MVCNFQRPYTVITLYFDKVICNDDTINTVTNYYNDNHVTFTFNVIFNYISTLTYYTINVSSPDSLLNIILFTIYFIIYYRHYINNIFFI